MRTRVLLTVASVLVAATAATAGLLDDFRAVVDARLARPAVPPAKLRVLSRARDDLRKRGLLHLNTFNARLAVQRIERVYARDAEFDSAESALVGTLTAALDADRATLAARTGTLGGAAKEARLAANLRLARIDLRRAAAARDPVGALGRLIAAAAHLRAAFPVQPNFHIADANPNSATFGRTVSPRSDIGVRTAWYFVHTT